MRSALVLIASVAGSLNVHAQIDVPTIDSNWVGWELSFHACPDSGGEMYYVDIQGQPLPSDSTIRITMWLPPEWSIAGDPWPCVSSVLSIEDTATLYTIMYIEVRQETALRSMAAANGIHVEGAAAAAVNFDGACPVPESELSSTSFMSVWHCDSVLVSDPGGWGDDYYEGTQEYCVAFFSGGPYTITIGYEYDPEYHYDSLLPVGEFIDVLKAVFRNVRAEWSEL
jgi:hypothetical protein